MLAFVADEIDMTFPGEVSIPLLADVRKQVPKAVCQVTPANVSTNLIINHGAPPFNNPELIKAIMLAIDRKGFNDILYQGEAAVGGQGELDAHGEAPRISPWRINAVAAVGGRRAGRARPVGAGGSDDDPADAGFA